MNRWMKALCVGLAVCAVLSLCGFSRDCGVIRSSVLRLHILAHSDRDGDQALKLQVRDGLLQKADGLFGNARNLADAEEVARAHLEELQQTAQEVVAAEGYAYPVRVELTRMYFDAREYDAGTLPAGVYHTLRVVIGKGEGQNWWCVAFPPICTGSATDLSGVLAEREQRMVEEPRRYRVGFKLVEWWESFCGWWS